LRKNFDWPWWTRCWVVGLANSIGLFRTSRRSKTLSYQFWSPLNDSNLSLPGDHLSCRVWKV
jgi:hypothetical protein